MNHKWKKEIKRGDTFADLTRDEEKQYQKLIQELRELAKPEQEYIKTEDVGQVNEKLVKESDGKLGEKNK